MRNMDLGDARKIVEAAHVDPTYYSFDGERHEALCIIAVVPKWRVFIRERDSQYEERCFSDEDAACVWFVKRLFQLWQPT